ncbi:MAG: helix-hairpin-helix domain-containing protein [Bryobacteraceae bacterium]|nr:helix-hairpin-helix domain-containing protein [Bryobacteraceae bacterium]
MNERQLKELRGVGKATLRDFDLLGIRDVDHLAKQDAGKLYKKLERLTGSRQDPCVLDVFRCAIEQARNPRLSLEKQNWWYWSRVRKAGAK